MSDDMIDMQRPYTWTDNRLLAGVVAAAAATWFATMFGEWFGSIGWVPFSFNTLNAEVWATNFKALGGFFAVTQGQALSADFTYFLGMWAHYSQGILFGLIFTLLVYPNLPGRMSVGMNLVKGLLWGWTLWLVSTSFVMPLLYGTGFWFSYWGSFGLPNGTQTDLVFYNFVWHSIYGFTLGMFFSPVSRSGGMSTGPKMGPIGHWAQIIVGWAVLIIGGWIASQGFTTCGATAGPACPTAYSSLTNGWAGAGQALAPWGVLVGLIGLIIATGPYFAGRWMKK